MRYHIRETDLFHNRTWMETYTYHFADLYREAVYNWEFGNKEDVPGAWVLAFEHAKNEDLLILQNIMLGINAHINRDLAYALHEVGSYTGNVTSKHQDSTHVNNVILVVYNLIEIPLLDLYTPAFPVNLTDYNFLIDAGIGDLVSLTRDTAFWNSLLFSTIWNDEDMMKELSTSIENSSVLYADIAIHGLDILGSIYLDMFELEGPNPLQTYCNLVPWGCY